jgi:hypothetical protein
MSRYPAIGSKRTGARLRLTTALAALLLAGCSTVSPGGVIHHTTIGVSGTAQNVSYGAAGRNLRTIVIGNPTSLPQEEFAAIVREHMEGANFGRPVHPVAADIMTPPEGYRLILAFGVARGVGDGTLCASLPAEQPPAHPSGSVSLKAAFCTDQRPVRSLTGEAFSAADPRNPQFRSFLRSVGLALFNPQNPDDRPDRDPPPIP